MKPTPLLLLVPLALASFGFSTMAPQQPSVWRQSQKTDAVGGTAYTRFTLAGKFLKSPQGDVPNRPAFALDCVPTQSSAKAGRLGTSPCGDLRNLPAKVNRV